VTTLEPHPYSDLVYGTWRLLDDPPSAEPEPLASRLELCADLGITTLDTAEIYGGYRVEQHLGAALHGRPGLRDRLQIITKCGIYAPAPGQPERRVAYYDATASRIVQSVERSLRLLGTDRIDLLLVHRPDWLTSASDTAAGLDHVLRDGKVLQVGVSNYSVEQYVTLQALVSQKLVTNQIELSMFHADPVVDGTLTRFEGLRVRPMAWSPLGGGRLFRSDDDAARRVQAVCRELAPRYGEASWEAIAIAWILALPGRPHVVLGTNKIDRIRRAAAAPALRLEREDWFLLTEAARGQKIP
jgi:predicted oxidoreductase